jgi:HSP20 family protein
MSTKELIRRNQGDLLSPLVFNDLFRPWNEWFDNDNLWTGTTMPAVNVIENKNSYKVTMAAPGLKKDDFKVEVVDNMVTISSEKEENREEKDEKYSRKEYNYSSFCRSFTLPKEVNKDKIEATYEGGILNLVIPKTTEAKVSSVKAIAVK